MRAGLKKYWCEWCRLWPLLHTCGIVLGGTKICHHSHPKALDVMNRGFSALCTFSTSHNRLYHQIEKRRAACVFVHNTSIYHPQPGRLATHWQGRVPLRRTLAKDKASKQNRLHRYKRRKLPRAQDQCRPGQDETLRGGERERLNAGRWRIGRRQDNPAAATAGLPREGEQGSGESQINLSLCTFLLSPASLPSPSQSTKEEVSRLACSPIRKGITFTHFLCRRKLKLDENVSGSANFLTNPWVIEVPGKEAFLCPCQIQLAGSQICSWGTSKQLDLDNKCDPRCVCGSPSPLWSH